jgi:hypothetical protein
MPRITPTKDGMPQKIINDATDTTSAAIAKPLVPVGFIGRYGS